MKPSIIIISLLSGLAAASSNDVNSKLLVIDSDFQKSGPSLDILNDYDVLLRQLNTEKDITSELERSNILSKIYYKKAIVELSLGKDQSSIENFSKSLEYNSNNPVVRKKLLDLCIKYGLKDRIYSLKKVFNGEDPDYLDALNTLNVVDALVASDDLGKLNEAINISPFDSSLRLKRIELTTQDIKQTGDSLKFLDLVDDMTSLIKTNPINHLEFINSLSEIYIFALSEFSNALNFNKKCLHYDMDNTLCKKNSKFLNKYSPILSNLSNFNKFFQFLEDKDKSDQDVDLDDEDMKMEATRLQDPSKFLKIRRENENFKTNQAYLLHKSQEFNTQYNLKANSLQLTILKTLIFDAFIRNDHKSFKSLSKKLNSIQENASETFLPLILRNVDMAIDKNDYNQAIQLLKQVTENGKKTVYYDTRAQKIQHHQNQQRQHQQREQQQRQQQYYQQQQQHQQRSRTPKNDYYKILEVPKDADQTTIRKAYREKTKQYHPDKYKGELSQQDIETKMTQINHAYEVLSDAELRKNYDQGQDPNDPESMHGGGGNGGMRQNPFGGHQNPFGNGGFNFQFGGPGGFQFGGGQGGGGFKFRDGKRKRRS